MNDNCLPETEPDPARKTADNCWLLGLLSIISTFIFPGILPIILACVGLAFFRTYQDTGNGQCLKTATTGRTMSIIAIVLQVAIVVVSIIGYLLFLVGTVNI